MNKLFLSAYLLCIFLCLSVSNSYVNGAYTETLTSETTFSRRSDGNVNVGIQVNYRLNNNFTKLYFVIYLYPKGSNIFDYNVLSATFELVTDYINGTQGSFTTTVTAKQSVADDLGIEPGDYVTTGIMVTNYTQSNVLNEPSSEEFTKWPSLSSSNLDSSSDSDSSLSSNNKTALAIVAILCVTVILVVYMKHKSKGSGFLSFGKQKAPQTIQYNNGRQSLVMRDQSGRITHHFKE